MSIFFKVDGVKNPTDWLSGDQNGHNASSVPASGAATTLSSGRSQSSGFPSAPVAGNTNRVPSGETVAPLAVDDRNVPFGGG